MPAYTTSPDELAQGLKVDVQGGPTRQDAAERLLRFGANALPDAGRGDSFIRALVGQLRNFLIILLLAATIIALAITEVVEAVTIAAIVVLAVLLGATQDWHEQRAILA